MEYIRWSVWRIFQIGALLYSAVLLLLLFFETTIVFPAPATQNEHPAATNNLELVDFKSVDSTKLHGYHYRHPNPQYYFLYCHGNATDISYLGSVATTLREKYGASVFLFDYRGYGESEGSPHEAGILQDGEAALETFAKRENISPNQIIPIGRSLGGGIAVHVAVKYQTKMVIIQNSFSSLVDVAANRYPVFPVRYLMRNQLRSDLKITEYKGFLFQSHAAQDRVVPYQFGKKLHDTYKGPKEFYSYESGHNSLLPPEYYDKLKVALQTQGESNEPLR